MNPVFYMSFTGSRFLILQDDDNLKADGVLFCKGEGSVRRERKWTLLVFVFIILCAAFLYLWVNRETIRNHAYISAETEEMDWSMSCREDMPFFLSEILY